MEGTSASKVLRGIFKAGDQGLGFRGQAPKIEGSIFWEGSSVNVVKFIFSQFVLQSSLPLKS